MTTSSPASMGGPLSEAERIAWIRHRLNAVTARDVGPAKADIDAECGRLQTARLDVSVWAVVDLEFLLNLVGVLEGQLATASEELERQRWYGEQLQMSIEGCSGNHLPIDEYDGGDDRG